MLRNQLIKGETDEKEDGNMKDKDRNLGKNIKCLVKLLPASDAIFPS